MEKIKFDKKIFTLFMVTLVFFVMMLPKNSLIAEGDSSQEEDIDYILVLDESGSMRNNDPENLRIEAAKLFTDLSSMLDAGSRISVVGFGSQTNIYLPLTEIEDGEQKIKDALDDIKSDQPLTDLKDVLLTIKEMLDDRQLKNDASVILLTDGAMTIDDIPPMTDEPEPEQEEDEQEREIPAGQVSKETTGIEFTSKGDEEEEEEPIPVDEPEEDEQTQGHKVDSQKAYLEEYKQQVFEISQNFKDAGIEIHTIAFTEEAEIKLLGKISSITDAGNWKAESALDIKDIYLEIFEHMTNRFLLKEDQNGQDPVTGSIEVDEEYDELVIIAFDNESIQDPEIEISDPDGNKYEPEIIEDTYKILQVTDPSDGIWDYYITGDSVIVYDFSDVEILEPESTLYLSGSDVIFKVRVTGNDSRNTPESFSVSYRIIYPDQSLSREMEFDYDQKTDVFEANFNDLTASGNYNTEIIINHLPTGSSSSKKISLESVYLGLDIVLLEPSDYEYEHGSEIPLQIEVSKKNQADTAMDLASLQIIARIKGKKEADISLNDKGLGSDENSGDGIYSGLVGNLTTGEEEILFFLIYNPLSSRDINTGIRKSIKLSKKENVLDETESKDPEEEVAPDQVSNKKDTIEEEEKLNGVVTFYWKIIIALASIISAVTIFLVIYFLYIRPKKRGY